MLKSVRRQRKRSPALGQPELKMATILAHELRNRLSRVVFGAEVVMDGAARDPELAHAAVRLRRGVDELLLSFDQLIDLVLALSGKAKLRRERINLVALVTAVVERARPLFVAREHALTMEMPAEPLWIHADFTSLETMVFNLLTNAAKFTPARGRVIVRLDSDGAGAKLTVSDTGIGIARRHLPRLFESFVAAREDGASKGLGAGLLVVRSIAELHGGAVSAHSKGVGRGSEFVVSLPRGAAVAARAEPAGPSRAVVLHHDAGVGGMIASLLRSWGHHVLVFDSADILSDQAAAFSPSVVIIDAALAETTPLALIQRLRRASGGGGARFILVRSAEQAFPDARAMGFDQTLSAPLDPDLLHAAVRDD